LFLNAHQNPTLMPLQNLRRTEQEQSVILAREKYEVDKVLEIDDKVKELNGATFCLQAGTTTELTLADYFISNGMSYSSP
jgi:hypothetical protein